jgi:hypothetical protein
MSLDPELQVFRARAGKGASGGQGTGMESSLSVISCACLTS